MPRWRKWRRRTGYYGPDNMGNVPNASSQGLDFGDAPAVAPTGYGSLQVHSHTEQQTIFACNHWSEGEEADLGTGNNLSGSPDWAFVRNAKAYLSGRIRVLVRTKY